MTHLLCKRNGEKYITIYYLPSATISKVQIQTSPSKWISYDKQSGCLCDKAVHVPMCKHRGDGKLKMRDSESSYPLVNNHIWHMRIISSWGTISIRFLLYWNEECSLLSTALMAVVQAVSQGRLSWYTMHLRNAPYRHLLPPTVQSNMKPGSRFVRQVDMICLKLSISH